MSHGGTSTLRIRALLGLNPDAKKIASTGNANSANAPKQKVH